MNTSPPLPPLPRDQRKIDTKHLNLPAIFHFIGSGLAVLGILFLCAGLLAGSASVVKAQGAEAGSAKEDSLPLPGEVAINPEAGRGGLLMVTLRLESGEELPFMVDSGSGTFFDKSLEPKLGKPIGTTAVQSWGVFKTNNVYAMPRLYLGSTPLKTGSQTVAYDVQHSFNQSGHPVMGILGMDVLEHYCLQLDFAAGKLRFLDAKQADKQNWGKAFPNVPLNSKDARPAVAANLAGMQGPHSLIDSGCSFDGWLMPQFYQQWTNQAVLPAKGEARSPDGMLDGEKYPFVDVAEKNVESDGIGLRFLARHLVTLDFPERTLYLQRQSIGPLPDLRLKTTRMAALDPLINAVLQNDVAAAQSELVKIGQSNATDLEKTVARNLAATLEDKPKPVPADVPLTVASLPLGGAHPNEAEVGWLKPTANRIPLNGEIQSPLLDSGKIHATGLFAHAPSRYVYDLGGKWKSLRGEAGLHTAFQGHAFGVVFVIKTDGKEVFRSDIIRRSEQARYEVEVTGVKTLELVVEKANDRNGGNWGLWLDPTLFRETESNK